MCENRRAVTFASQMAMARVALGTHMALEGIGAAVTETQTRPNGQEGYPALPIAPNPLPSILAHPPIFDTSQRATML